MWSLLLVVACSEAPSVSEPASAAAPSAARGSRADADVEALGAALAGGAKVLDVRTPEEFAGGHVPGAVNLPIGSFSPAAGHPALAGLDPATPTWVICASGGRSARAADELAAAGFSVVNVTGGTKAWIDAGKPVER